MAEALKSLSKSGSTSSALEEVIRAMLEKPSDMEAHRFSIKTTCERCEIPAFKRRFSSFRDGPPGLTSFEVQKYGCVVISAVCASELQHFAVDRGAVEALLPLLQAPDTGRWALEECSKERPELLGEAF